MKKSSQKREKSCKACQAREEVMYRCRSSKEVSWDFFCKTCMQSLREKNKEYQYGGTWKK
jgi:hypothetical protein